MDKQLPDKLRTELPGILTWAVRGCLQWQEHGLEAPKRVTEATDDYRVEIDTLGDFLEERCEFDPDYKTTSKDLYSAYQAWCLENSID